MDAITLTDEHVTALTNWIQLVQMQDDIVSKDDVDSELNRITNEVE